MPPTTVDWAESLVAVASMAGRVARLIRSLPDPSVPTLGVWDAGQLAAHMAHVFEVDLGLIRGLPSPLADLDDLAVLTQALVRDEPPVDLEALATRVEVASGQFLAEAALLQGDEIRTWLGGAKVPVTALASHIISENMLHGVDMSAATGRPWPILRSDASLAFLGFICPLVSALDKPRYAVDQERAAGLRACFDVRLRGGGRAFFVFSDGTLSIEGPSDRRVDCHLWMDPRAVMLLAWGRTSLPVAMAKGQIVPWGRRAWLAPRLPGLIATP